MQAQAQGWVALFDLCEQPVRCTGLDTDGVRARGQSRQSMISINNDPRLDVTEAGKDPRDSNQCTLCEQLVTCCHVKRPCSLLTQQRFIGTQCGVVSVTCCLRDIHATDSQFSRQTFDTQWFISIGLPACHSARSGAEILSKLFQCLVLSLRDQIVIKATFQHGGKVLAKAVDHQANADRRRHCQREACQRHA